MNLDQEIRRLERQIDSLSEPDYLPYLSRLNLLRLRRGEKFPAIKIGDYWHEVEHTEKLFEPDNRYTIPTGLMGLLRLKNQRELYFFGSDVDLDELRKNTEHLQETVALGNIAHFNIPSENSGYTSDVWGDDYDGQEDPGWYFYIDGYYGGEDQGPYETEIECENAFGEALEEVYPDGWKLEDRQQIYNAETIHEYWKHPGIFVEYDYNNEPEENDYNQKFADWLEHDFNSSIEYGLWLVPLVRPPFENKPEWIDWYK